MATYTAQPTPIGTSSSGSYSPVPAPAPSAQPSSNNDWNTQWNQIYNQAWNAGYNSGSKPQVDSSFSSAVDQGYSAGQSKYNSSKSTGSGISGQVLSATVNNDQIQNDLQSEVQKQQDAIRSQITGGYDSYFSSLDEQLNSSLPSQYGIQNQMIEANKQSNLGDLTTQKTLGEADLQAESQKNQLNQVKSLKDVAGNIRNMLQAGNNYLGARNASDSSATNQYSYALTKLGTQQRGNVMSQTRDIESEIAGRKFKLGTLYNNEVNKINTEAQTKALEVQNWFYQEQDRIRSMKAQGQLSRSQDLGSLSTQLYNQAIAKLQNYQGEVAQKRASLETWAMNASKTTAELIANLNKVSQYTAQNPTWTPYNGNMNFSDGQTANIGQYRGGVGTDNSEDDLFN